MEKADRIVIDTSAWIEGFSRKSNVELQNVIRECLDSDTAAISPIVLLELIQGCKTEKEKQSLREDMEALELLGISSQVWERAYELGFLLRRKGVTVPTVDILVASQAIESSCVLLHHDVHFEMIARHSKLKTISFLETK